ncbi:MAG: hypothetical protein EOP84_10630 [Verrucomicrobiaceae bacterium]|nr:MAG: hypothetical protein EOP84_10630 [Verrucomicrobiaceae bacterium]
MEGDIHSEEEAGIVPRAVKAILEQLEGSGSEFTVRVSFLELCKHTHLIIDTLVHGNTPLYCLIRQRGAAGPAEHLGREEAEVVRRREKRSGLPEPRGDRRTQRGGHPRDPATGHPAAPDCRHAVQQELVPVAHDLHAEDHDQGVQRGR